MMNDIKKKNRNRSKNFTDAEKEQFISICLASKNILENKKTDKETLKLKNEAWEDIVCKYNAVQTTGMREMKSLKILYDNLKMKARRERYEERKELHKNGNGTFTTSMTPLLSQILSEPVEQFEPLINRYDSSSSFYSEGIDTNSKEALPTDYLDVKEDSRLQFGNIHDENNKDEQNQTSSGETKLNRSTSSTGLSCSSNYEENDYKKVKLMYLEEEHKKRMEILEIQRETAAVKLRNTLLKEKILNLQYNNRECVEKKLN